MFANLFLFVWLILQLDDWVLCRIYNKKGVIERYDTVDDDEVADAAAGDVKPAAAAKNPRGRAPMKVEMADYGGYYDDGYDLETPSAGMLCFDRPPAVAPVPAAPAPAPVLSPAEPDPDRDSTSMPWMHTDNSSSGSEHVLSPSPDLPDRDHAESQPGGGCAGWWPGADWAGGDDGFVVLDDGGAALFGPPSPGLFARVDAAALGDMLAYLQRPF